jgi:hypothetical protein
MKFIQMTLMAGLIAINANSKTIAQCTVPAENYGEVTGKFLLWQHMKRDGMLSSIKVKGGFMNIPEQ